MEYEEIKDYVCLLGTDEVSEDGINWRLIPASWIGKPVGDYRIYNFKFRGRYSLKLEDMRCEFMFYAPPWRKDWWKFWKTKYKIEDIT